MSDNIIVVSDGGSQSVIETVADPNTVVVIADASSTIEVLEDHSIVVTDDGFVDVITVPEQGPPGGEASVSLTGDIVGSGVGTIQTSIAPKSVTSDKLADLSSKGVLGRKSTGTGSVEPLSASDILDFLSNTHTRGDILYRSSSGWSVLPPGASGQFLKTLGAGSDPSWATVVAGGGGSEIVSMVNGESVSLMFGSVVYAFAADTAKLAQANSSTTRRAFGLVIDDIVPTGSNANILLSGPLLGSTSQWDYLTGETGGLVTNAPYYLSTSSPGKLTRIGPYSILGESLWSVPIGIALSPTKLKIEIQQSVKL